jgi:hypothetical protein
MTEPTVTFEVERFEWTAPGRLEVVGRWFGLRGQRFLRPTLDVEVGGQSRRLLALLEHKPWVAAEGGEWVATFAWEGDPVDFTGAELAVGPDLAVELPPAGVPAAAAKRKAEERVAERREAAPPRVERLKNELTAAHAQVDRLTTELGRERAARTTDSMDMNGRLTAERQAVRKLSSELRAAREQLSAAESTAARQLQQLRELERELDAARSARESALENAEKLVREVETARRRQAAAEHEREAAIRARDRARMERNAWLSRARAAQTEPPRAILEDELGERKPVG